MKSRTEYIMNNLQKKYDYLIAKDYEVVALFLQGSQNYNLDIYDDEYQSDIDAKAIVLPTLDDIILNKRPVSTTIVLDNEEHIDVKDIRIMRDMFLKQNISYIELLYTDFYIINDKYKEFYDGIGTLKSGVSDLNDGAKELNKGQKKFYKEGIKKLDDTVNGDLQDILDRFEVIQSDDVMYTTFTDRSGDMDGNVKFIFESDPIEISDDEK